MIYVLSGGASLNYKVVGGTSEPSNPVENTIWVNTDTAITSHVFSATEPANPAEGMVWFYISNISNAPINAIKKNGLWVYPTDCQQYIGGEWVTKESKAYQGGAWNDVRLPTIWLFNNGDLGKSGGFQTTAGTLNVGSTIDLTISSGEAAYVTAKNQIDLTSFSTITFVCKAGGVTTEFACVGVGVTRNAFVASTSAKSTSYATVTVDVAKLQGLHYVGFADRSYSAANTSNFYVESILVS